MASDGANMAYIYIYYASASQIKVYVLPSCLAQDCSVHGVSLILAVLRKVVITIYFFLELKNSFLLYLSQDELFIEILLVLYLYFRECVNLVCLYLPVSPWYLNWCPIPSIPILKKSCLWSRILLLTLHCSLNYKIGFLHYFFQNTLCLIYYS